MTGTLHHHPARFRPLPPRPEDTPSADAIAASHAAMHATSDALMAVSGAASRLHRGLVAEAATLLATARIHLEAARRAVEACEREIGAEP